MEKRNIFFGSIVNYSSFNKFNHKIYRDANIVTSLDTFTSLLAGCCTFGIIGHLAHELGVEDVSKVVKSGAGLGNMNKSSFRAFINFFTNVICSFYFVSERHRQVQNISTSIFRFILPDVVSSGNRKSSCYGICCDNISERSIS
jgi:Sodium:neurotransmitter symporter family